MPQWFTWSSLLALLPVGSVDRAEEEQRRRRREEFLQMLHENSKVLLQLAVRLVQVSGMLREMPTLRICA